MSSKHVPDYLYKYKAIEKDPSKDRALETLSRGKLWASNPGQFNDPFDCQIKLDDSIYFENLSLYKASMEDVISIKEINEIISKSEKSEKKIIQYLEDHLHDNGKKTIRERIDDWLQARSKNAGVISLSEQNDNLLMWAHYANYHHGYCLKFAVNECVNRIKKVDYGNNLPSLIDMKPSFKNELDPIALMNGEERNREIDVTENELFCYKSKAWEYEKEWRYLINIEEETLGKEISINGGTGLTLIGVIFGARMSDNDKKPVIEAIKKTNIKVTYEKAIILNSKFGVEIIKDCDISDAES